VNVGKEECTLVTEAPVYQVCHVSEGLKTEMHEVLGPKAQSWIMNAAQLKLTSIYGFRRYLRDSWMPGHVDRIGTHVNKSYMHLGGVRGV
jgi:hypothetical protein